MSENKVSLMYKVLVVMIAMSVVPVLTVGIISMDAAKDLGYSAVDDSRNMGNSAVDISRGALDNKSVESIELRAFETALDIRDFLREREDDIILISSLTPDNITYKAFLESKTKNIWWNSTHNLSRPVFTEAVYFDIYGMEQFRVASNLWDNGSFSTDAWLAAPNASTFANATALLNISAPANTAFKTETYFAHAKTLNNGEVYLSELKGWLVNVSEAYLGQDRSTGKRYEGIYRWITPVTSNTGVITGYVMLSMDQIHIEEFTDHITPSADRFVQGNPASTGNYAYLLANDTMLNTHPNDFYKKGYLPNGSLPEPYGGNPVAGGGYTVTEDELLTNMATLLNPSNDTKATQLAKAGSQKTTHGYIPLNAAWLTFATGPGLVEICYMGLNGTDYGHNYYIWEGNAKYVAFGAVHYGSKYGDRVVNLDHEIGFGLVGIGAEVSEFHMAADTVDTLIESETNATAKTIEGKTEDLGSDNVIFITVSIVAIVAIVVAFLLSSSIINPIKRFTEVANKVSTGDVFSDTEIKVKSNDEIGDLAESFKRMVASIKASVIMMNPEMEEKLMGGGEKADDTKEE